MAGGSRAAAPTEAAARVMATGLCVTAKNVTNRGKNSFNTACVSALESLVILTALHPTNASESDLARQSIDDHTQPTPTTCSPHDVAVHFGNVRQERAGDEGLFNVLQSLVLAEGKLAQGHWLKDIGSRRVTQAVK